MKHIQSLTNWFEDDFYGDFSFRIENFYEDCEEEDEKAPHRVCFANG
jgi:hypothetical protein